MSVFGGGHGEPDVGWEDVSAACSHGVRLGLYCVGCERDRTGRTHGPHDLHVAAYTPACPECGSAELLRVSEETQTFMQPVKALRWWGSGRVRVEAEGDRIDGSWGVRTVGIRCQTCGYMGDEALFAKEIADAR